MRIMVRPRQSTTERSHPECSQRATPSLSTASKNLRYGSHRLVLDPVQVILVAETFSVDLENVFSARRPCRKPSHFGFDLDTAKGLVVARCLGSRRPNRIAS